MTQLYKGLTSSNDEILPSAPNTSILESEPLTKKPNLYRVIILNDDYTPMEFVIFILQSFFGMDKDKATQIMLAVHTNGKGVCGIFTKEVAETKSQQINNFAKENEHPLVTDVEELDNE
jgi:ATP-dependent Clp protease adaptor protein ClpS|tara:strand:- start:1910 stop:2266 length:357 start_codon:yes stop_codon:yes gene_type:complete